MPSPEAWRRLLETVHRESDLGRALLAIAEAARDSTRSRNALIALLDVEAGHLEISHAVGPDWTSDREGKTLQVAIGSREGITAYVAATGKPFVTGDVRDVPAYHQLFETTRSEMAVPIRTASGRLAAVLNLESDVANRFGPSDVAEAEAIAVVAALVLERASARQREEALVEIGTAMDDVLVESEVMDRIVDVAGRVLRFQACSIFLLDPRTQSYVLRASTGALRDKIGEFSYQAGEGFTGWVCASGQPILLHRPQDDPRWRGKFTEIPSSEIASFLAVPIVIRGKSIGAIRALRRFPDNEYLDNRFEDSDLRLMQAIADQSAVALDSVRAIEKLVHSERMSAWGELSAKSSHMIGNRVFAVRGDVNEMGHLVRTEAPDADALRDLHRGLETNVGRLQELLQDFRDFVAATQLHKSEADLNAWVRETVREVFPKRSTIELSLELDPSLPVVSFDPSKLRLALGELIENAMSFMEEGRLEIETGIAPAEAVSRSKLPPAGRYVFLSVADTGPGVDPSAKDSIFVPFFTSRARGLGLGLSIVKGISDAHGGTVIETGEPGGGARFMILLPVSDRPNPGT